MEYECQLISLAKLMITHKGPFEQTLCDSCISADCSHKLKKKNISIFGVTKEHKVMCRGGQVYFVVDCRGYVSPEG